MGIRLPKAFPECYQEKCFANKYSKCLLLQHAYDEPDNADCPFSKTKDEYNAGLKKYGGMRKEN